MALSGKVALVSGASRGIGKGVALQLGEAGATVYLTGRTLEASSPATGILADLSVARTAKEIDSRGGKGIAVLCDHSKDEDIEKVFKKIIAEQGRLDILVNSAFSAHNAIFEHFGSPFWEIPEAFWDDVINVGLRNNYICAVKAAKIMTKQKSGLIVNISSAAALAYDITPAIGIAKTGTNRMAADCALELRPHNVTFISLWPGGANTEYYQNQQVLIKTGAAQVWKPISRETLPLGSNALTAELLFQAPKEDSYIHIESTQFSGKCVVALFQDPNLLQKSGKPFTTAAIGREYDFADIDGIRIDDSYLEYFEKPN